MLIVMCIYIVLYIAIYIYAVKHVKTHDMYQKHTFPADLIWSKHVQTGSELQLGPNWYSRLTSQKESNNIVYIDYQIIVSGNQSGWDGLGN